jgi:H+/Cl- antiporter ClcA
MADHFYDGDRLPTGPGAAAVLAAGIGCLALGALALASDAFPLLDRAMRFWPPSGSLSGVSTSAVAIWLCAWFLLARRWNRRDVALRPVTLAAGVMLLAGLLLTFPPFMDLLQGR